MAWIIVLTVLVVTLPVCKVVGSTFSKFHGCGQNMVSYVVPLSGQLLIYKEGMNCYTLNICKNGMNIGTCTKNFFCQNFLQILEDHTIKTVAAKSPIYCIKICDQLFNCTAVNMQRGGHGNVHCELKDYPEIYNCADFIPRLGSAHYTKASFLWSSVENVRGFGKNSSQPVLSGP